MIAQDERDKAMAELLIAIIDLYDFVIEANPLPEVTGKRQELLNVMLSQTAEVAYFIRDNAEVKNFCKDYLLGHNYTTVLTNHRIRAASGKERDFWLQD